MLTLLRRLRRQLLAENRFTRYLIYAIGEIILVVIGILIAVQINNWNEHKKLENQLQVALRDVRNELIFNIRMGEVRMDFIRGLEEQGRILFDVHSNQQTDYADSVIGIAFRRAAFPISIAFHDRKYLVLQDTPLYEETVTDTIKNEFINYYREMRQINEYVEKSNQKKEAFFMELTPYYKIKTLGNRVGLEYRYVDFYPEEFRRDKHLNPIIAELVDVNNDIYRIVEGNTARARKLVGMLE